MWHAAGHGNASRAVYIGCLDWRRRIQRLIGRPRNLLRRWIVGRHMDFACRASILALFPRLHECRRLSCVSAVAIRVWLSIAVSDRARQKAWCWRVAHLVPVVDLNRLADGSDFQSHYHAV